MAKLYFKYGSMGSSKTAQALITKFNYEERNMKVWLFKPSIDTRDKASVVKSRVGLEAPASLIEPHIQLYDLFEKEHSDCDVIIVDEAQFLTPKQVDELGDLVLDKNIPVLCFGLRTDFLTHTFPGSQRLFEIAESISEIKNVCDCGRKATVNARIDRNGKIITVGEQIHIGGNDSYIAMCRRCYKQKIREQESCNV